MLDSNVKYNNSMKTSYYLIELLLVFSNSVSFGTTLIRPKAVTTKTTLIISRIDELIHVKMFEINEMYRVKMERKFYFIKLFIVFQYYCVICNDTSKA